MCEGLLTRLSNCTRVTRNQATVRVRGQLLMDFAESVWFARCSSYGIHSAKGLPRGRLQYTPC